MSIRDSAEGGRKARRHAEWHFLRRGGVAPTQEALTCASSAILDNECAAIERGKDGAWGVSRRWIEGGGEGGGSVSVSVEVLEQKFEVVRVWEVGSGPPPSTSQAKPFKCSGSSASNVASHAEALKLTCTLELTKHISHVAYGLAGALLRAVAGANAFAIAESILFPCAETFDTARTEHASPSTWTPTENFLPVTRLCERLD